MTTVFDTNLQTLEEQIRGVLQNQTDIPIDQILNQAHPADIADVLERLPAKQIWKLFLKLEIDRGAAVLHELGREATRQMLREITDEDIAPYLNAMPMDEVADILSHDVPWRQETLLAAMRPTDAREVRDLIGYPPDSAGRLMTEKFVRLPRQIRVEEVLDYLRQVDSEVETLTDLYVLGDNGILLGIVSLREIITASDQQAPVQDIMVTDLITVTPETDQEDAVLLVAHYDILALPVVSEAGRLLGIITVDDIIDVLTHEDTEDILRYAAVGDSGMMDQPYFTVSLPDTF